jgi:hypothetical protein
MTELTSPTIDIAPNGDIILNVGPKRKKRKTMRVQSVFLKAASKPFTALLDPRWKESFSTIKKDESREISLPDDSPVALQAICAVIHHKYDEVPPNLGPDDILEIAIAADKYDCLDVLEYSSKVWLSAINTKVHSVEDVHSLMALTAATYRFRDVEAFKKYTKALVLRHGDSFINLWSEKLGYIINMRLLCESLSYSSNMLYSLFCIGSAIKMHD